MIQVFVIGQQETRLVKMVIAVKEVILHSLLQRKLCFVDQLPKKSPASKPKANQISLKT